MELILLLNSFSLRFLSLKVLLSIPLSSLFSVSTAVLSFSDAASYFSLKSSADL